MVAGFHDVRNLSLERGVDYRTAAFAIAIRKVATAYQERGIFP
jgi:hypothetical protein